MPGCGKTTVGKMLAQKLNFEFVDTDSLIEAREGLIISEIFKLRGEEYFRDCETSIIQSLSKIHNSVISVGGGAYQKQINRTILKGLGVNFYLYCSPMEIYIRIKGDSSRPLLNSDNPLEKLEDLYEKRHKDFELSDYIIDTVNISQYDIVEHILRIKNGTSFGN